MSNNDVDESCLSGLPKLGDKIFVRTVTYHYTGRVARIDDGFLVLVDAAWIGDTGRFATALQTGNLKEVEPYSVPVRVSLASVVDWCPWLHLLPREQK